MSPDLFSDLSAVSPFPPLRPFDAMPRGNVAVVAPHPDDETIGCGGTIALHARRGDRVRIIHVTDGAGGDRDAREGGRIREVRRAEARAAARWLGAEEPLELGLPDGGVQPDEASLGVLRGALEDRVWAVVYAPSPFECHPDHIAACLATAETLRRIGGDARLCLYEVNQPHLPGFMIDVTPAAQVKRRALACFLSQIRYVDVVAKAMGGSYARTVNVDLREILYAEAFIELEAERVRTLAAHLLSLRQWISQSSRISQ